MADVIAAPPAIQADSYRLPGSFIRGGLPRSAKDRVLYGEALASGIDDEVMKAMYGRRAVGSNDFASTLKMERGRYRLKHARAVQPGAS